MTEESPLERLKRASASAKSAVGDTAPKPAQAPSGLSEDAVRQQAYDKAMGKSFINKEGVTSVKSQLSNNFNETAKFGSGVVHGSIWAYKHILRPAAKAITSPIWYPIKKIGIKNIRDSFNRWVSPLDEKGKPHLSVNRAGLAVTGAAALFAGAAAAAVEIPHLAWEGAKDVAWSATTGMWYAGTHEHVKMVMHSSRMHETDDLKGVAEGCTEMPCTQTNSWHFVIDDSGFHQVHSLATGNGIFDPRRIVSAVADTYNICEEDIYGAPHKLLYKWGVMNPRLIGVTACYPMEQRFDPAYITYINTILESKGSLADSIRTLPFEGGRAPLATVSPTIAPK